MPHWDFEADAYHIERDLLVVHAELLLKAPRLRIENLQGTSSCNVISINKRRSSIIIRGHVPSESWNEPDLCPSLPPNLRTAQQTLTFNFLACCVPLLCCCSAVQLAVWLKRLPHLCRWERSSADDTQNGRYASFTFCRPAPHQARCLCQAMPRLLCLTSTTPMFSRRADC